MQSIMQVGCDNLGWASNLALLVSHKGTSLCSRAEPT